MREARRAYLIQNGRPTKVTKLVNAGKVASGGDHIVWSAELGLSGTHIFWQYFPRTKPGCKTRPELISTNRFLEGSIVLDLFINEDGAFLVHLQVPEASLPDR